MRWRRDDGPLIYGMDKVHWIRMKIYPSLWFGVRAAFPCCGCVTECSSSAHPLMAMHASFGRFRPNMEYNTVGRGPAAYSMHQCWGRFEHWGDVPTMDERLYLFAYYQTFGADQDDDLDDGGASTTSESHGGASSTEGDEPHPAASSCAPKQPVSKWIVDTGSGHDLI